ncbi:Fe-S cluster assembly protein SufD [Aliifodinibius sp. S!AR15-10]|uniref:Fe-S cluster assembly protein SufD n=1 Tax=Aliifodinibius sp. S!AR15-10 TaxID=2950437 RepID=UPI002862436C|nr:Fe-S cluster assembly protein SufD [Aliifodinibius sp. S!AR15-10]MDR8391044.1 Fe-S cluster assembly protein SufD [Aliifodinibius sp. S!AR15-10]
MSNITKQKNKDTFLSDLLEFQGSLNGKSNLLDELRLKGADEVRNGRFPQPKDEDWRFISLRELYQDNYKAADELKDQVESVDFSNYLLPEAEKSRLVFINGEFSEEHSNVDALPKGVKAGNLASFAAKDDKQIKKHLNQYADFEDDIFTSFNNAFLQDGAFIYVPEGVEVEAPVHILFVQTDAPENYFVTPRCLVVAEKSSKLNLVEDYVGLGGNKYFNCPAIEVNLEEEAHVIHTRIQRDSEKSIHIGRVGAHVNHHSNYESYTINIGAKLSRNEPRVTQLAEEVEFTLDGLVLIDGDQVSDTHSVMDHRFSHAESHQLHKCVINDKAHSVFNGKIFVRKDAQKIDSFQENRNLLLSRGGTVNTKPQLEIFADDVVCTHGATVGQLEEDEVFYLKSRGLTEEKARELLVYAFALETIENIPVDSVQELLVNEVHNFTNRQLDSELVV